MKVVSFVFWGNNPLYLEGAVANAFLTTKHLPGWEFRLYCVADLPKDTATRLVDLNAKIIKVERHFLKDINIQKSYMASLYRFFPLQDPEIECFLSRDLDSRISMKDRVVSDQFIGSEKTLGIYVTAKRNNYISAGTFACRGGIIDSLKAEVLKACGPTPGDYSWGVDQRFLQRFFASFVQNRDYICIADRGVTESRYELTPISDDRMEGEIGEYRTDLTYSSNNRIPGILPKPYWHEFVARGEERQKILHDVFQCDCKRCREIRALIAPMDS